MKPDKHKKKASNTYRKQHDLKSNNQKKKESEELKLKVEDEESISKPGTSGMVEDDELASQAEVEIKYRKREVVVQKDKVFELPEEEVVQKIGKSVYDIINAPGSYKHLLLKSAKVEKVEKFEPIEIPKSKEVKLSMISSKIAAEFKRFDQASEFQVTENNDERKVTYNDDNRLTACNVYERETFEENVSAYGDAIKDVYLNNLKHFGNSDPLDYSKFGTVSKKELKFLRKEEKKVVRLNSYEYPVELQQDEDTSTNATEALLKKYEENKSPDRCIDPIVQTLLKIVKSKTRKKDRNKKCIDKFMNQFRQMMIPVPELNGDIEKMEKETYLSGPAPVIKEFIPIALNKYNGSEESLNDTNSEDELPYENHSELHSKTQSEIKDELHSETHYEFYSKPHYALLSEPDIDEKKSSATFYDNNMSQKNETEDVKEELHPGTDDMSMDDILNLIR